MSRHAEANFVPQADADASPLCLSCLQPNAPASHFCSKCGAPMTSYAATGPFEHLFAEGFVYREAASRPRSLIVVLGVWLIFGSIALVGAVFFVGSAQGEVGAGLLGVGTVAMALLMIYRTTRRFRSRPKMEARKSVEPLGRDVG